MDIHFIQYLLGGGGVKGVNEWIYPKEGVGE